MEFTKASLHNFTTIAPTTVASIIRYADKNIHQWPMHISFNDSSECRLVTQLGNVDLQCQFARVVDDCYDEGKIDYIKLTYCTLESTIVATFLFVFILALLFVAIGTTADDFLCPLMVSISKSLKLSDNIAGVTFLAFGNGAPDIFSSIIGIGNSDPSMVIGQLYGAGIFVTTIVVGSILIRERFQIMHRPLLRDIAFYLITTMLVWLTFLSQQIKLVNSLVFIGIYFVYVVVVVASGIIYRRNQVIVNQETENGGKIFHKKNSQMPRDNLKRAKKYRIQDDTASDNGSYDRQMSTDSAKSVSKISLKSFFQRQNSDNYEGVVLRRIKFRKYAHDVMHERRLTAYNLPGLSNVYDLSGDKPDLVTVEPTYAAKYVNYGLNTSQSANHNDDLDVNHNQVHEDHNNNNEGNGDTNKPANFYEIVIDPKHLQHRRVTISDQNFPVLHHTSSIFSLSQAKNNQTESSSDNNNKSTNSNSLEKFSVANFLGNLRLNLIQIFNPQMHKSENDENNNSETQQDKNNNNSKQFANVEETITAVNYDQLGQQQMSYAHLDRADKRASDQTKKDDSNNEDELNWCRCLIEALCRASHCDLQEFHELSPIGKVLMIVKAPIYFVFTLTIPVVDPELPLDGWNKFLILLQLVLSPQCCLLITEISIAALSRLQLHLIVLAISILFIPLVALTSQPYKQPSYHIVFAYFGFIIAIAWIYTIANEVVSLLKAIGVIFNLSQFMLGLTFLAWGNSIGDFISNLTMARNGFPRMAISACFGGPVLNMLLGIGVPYTYLLVKQQGTLPSIELVYSRMITVMYSTITCSLVTTIVILVFCTKFASTKVHGFILYALYGVFLTAAIFTEIQNST